MMSKVILSASQSIGIKRWCLSKTTNPLWRSFSTIVAKPRNNLVGWSKCSTYNHVLVPRCNLYSDSSLGMYKLEHLRDNRQKLFVGPARERYVKRVAEYLSSEEKTVYKDDLINLIGLAETDEHLDMIEKIVTSSESDPSGFLKGWSVTLARLYYQMNRIDRAIKNVYDVERFGDFFNELMTYRIVMTMLYNAGRYLEVYDMYIFANERLAKKMDNKEDRGDGLANLVLAALSKLNNEEAMQRAEKIHSMLNPNKIGLRITSFLAYMAVNNNRPKFALNLISNTQSRNYVTLRELKVISLFKLDRYDDVILQLRSYLQNIRRDTHVILQSTQEWIERSIEKIQDEDMRSEVKNMLVELKEGGHVSNATLEEILYQEIQRERLTSDQSDRGYKPYYPKSGGRRPNTNFSDRGSDDLPRGEKRFTYQKMDFSS